MQIQYIIYYTSIPDHSAAESAEIITNSAFQQTRFHIILYKTVIANQAERRSGKQMKTIGRSVKMSVLLAVLFCLTGFLPVSVYATAGNPYSQTYTDSNGVYHPGNCTWQTWEECYARLGVKLPAWHNGGTWHTSAQAAGYQVVQWYEGYVPPNDCIIEWSGHVAWLISADSVGANLVDGNILMQGSYVARLERWWSWADLKRYRGNPTYITIVKPQTGHLDVNGLLDGSENGGLGSYGTCDVYINGSLAANDVNDYYHEWNAGTTYRIDDIRAASGYSYDGVASGALSGTIGSGSTANVRLKFNSCRLDVNGLLDGKTAGDLGSYGTFDVYIGGNLAADDVNDFSQLVPKGSSYQITDIKASDGHAYDGISSGSLTGTIGSGRTTVSLKFYTIGELSGDWIEVDYLPGNVTPDICDIEYKYSSTKVASSSPGAGWTQKPGSATTRYENSGGVTESDWELSTSNTRVYVGSYYYHFCGASTGVNVEHYNDGTHTDYHVAGDVTQFNVIGGPWTDDNDSRYLAYKIAWKSGQWAGGDATCAADRSAIWYRRWQYQNKVAVTYYTWEKITDWQSEKDPSLTPSKYRYRLKDTEDPAIASVEVTEVTPDGYTVTCQASDNTGIIRAVFVSWTDTETMDNPVIQEVALTSAETSCEVSATIAASGHFNEKDVWYHTKVIVYDQVGNSAEYSEDDTSTYIPTLVRSSRKLFLPAGLKEIEESAFEGTIGFGEVILPEGTEKIGSKAFADNGRLSLIYMPDTVTEIAEDAFEESDNVVLVCESNNAAAAYARANQIPYLTGGFTL